MKLHQIRNATIIIEYGGLRFLIDPMFAPKEAYPPITINPWPYHDLPMSPKDIVKNIDAVILTHLHIDHFDKYAQNALSNDTKIYVQDIYDKNALEKENFHNIEVLAYEGTKAGNVTLYKTDCLHGIRFFAEPVFLGNGMRWEACGVVFKSENEPTVYLAGDTIWYEGVKESIDKYNPKYIIVNAACAQTEHSGALNMGIEDIRELHTYAPQAKLLATHMDNVGHATICRRNLRESDVNDYIYAPADGEIMTLE